MIIKGNFEKSLYSILNYNSTIQLNFAPKIGGITYLDSSLKAFSTFGTLDGVEEHTGNGMGSTGWSSTVSVNV